MTRSTPSVKAAERKVIAAAIKLHADMIFIDPCDQVNKLFDAISALLAARRAIRGQKGKVSK